MRAPRKNPELNDAIEVLDQHFIQSNKDNAAAWATLPSDSLQWVAAELDKAYNLRYYLENYHFITDTHGVLKSLYPFWDHQEIVYEAYSEEWEENGYCKLIILKPRQTGISTWIAASMFHRTIFTPHSFTMLIAQNDNTSGHIYKMSQRAFDNLPWWMQPETMYRTKTGAMEWDRVDEKERMVNPGLGSNFTVASATRVSGVAIGKTIRNLHMSEVSRYPDDSIFEGDIKPSLNARDTYAVMESTGFGRQGLFYEQWCAAVEGDTDFCAVFIPVYKVRKYYKPITKGKIELTEEETAFNERVKKEDNFAIPDEFWNFRRTGLRAARRTRDGKAGFLESYPLTPQEAFQSSGLCAFDKDSLEHQDLKYVHDPLWLGEINLISIDPPRIDTDNIHEVHSKDEIPRRKSGRGGNRFFVWEMPEKGESYYVSADVALGNGGDYSVCEIWRAGRGLEPDAQVAEWWGWIPPKKFAHVVAAIGIFYNNAEVACEYARDGITTANELRDMDYPNLYRPQWKDKIVNQATNYLHWYTNTKTRDEIIGCMNEALLDRTIIIRSADLIDEMIDFAAVESGGKIEGQGNDDDGCMSAMINLYCLRETLKHLKAGAEQARSAEGQEQHVWGVYDQIRRQRGQYNTKAGAEKMIAGRPGWFVQAILVTKANTIWSPIFDAMGAEQEIHSRYGIHSTEITPDMVYAYKTSMRNFGGNNDEYSDEWSPY